MLPIWIPPLRARAGDIDALARHFCRQFGAANGREASWRSRPTRWRGCGKQPWPGNVRQLQNFIERLVVLSDGDGADRGGRRCASWRASRPSP